MRFLFFALKNAKSVTKQKHIIIEKFISGKEYGAEVFVQNKKVWGSLSICAPLGF